MAIVRSGIITGREITKNKDGENDRVMLQVQVSNKDDIQTIEYVSLPGQDENPVDGSRIIIFEISPSYRVAIAVDEGVTPEMDEGEKRIYALSGSSVVSMIKLLKTGIIEINGNGDFAVRWTALNTALQTFVTSLNAALATKEDGAGSPGALTLDLSSAKIEEIKVPSV
jgi:phage gp45-like